MKETGLNTRQLYLSKKLNFILLIFCLCHIGSFTSETNCAIKSPPVSFSFEVPKKFGPLGGIVLAGTNYYVYTINTK